MSTYSRHQLHPDLWNTGTNQIHNETPWTLSVIDGEDSSRAHAYAPGEIGFFPGTHNVNSTILPWCINSIEVAQKAFHVYDGPLAQVHGTHWLVSVFQYYRDDQVYYLPYGASFGSRIYCQEGPSSYVELYLTAPSGASATTAPGSTDIAVRAAAVAAAVMSESDKSR